ncbi:hypothetical protein Tco_0737195 [Tanacetum coccineum]
MKHDSSFSQNPNDDMSFEELAEKSDLHLLLHALPWNSWNLTYCPLLAVLAQWRQKILAPHHDFSWMDILPGKSTRPGCSSFMEPWKNLDPYGSTVTGKHSTTTTMHGIMFDLDLLNKSNEASDDDCASASNGSGRISNAGMGLSEAISLLEPLTLDVTDFVHQGSHMKGPGLIFQLRNGDVHGTVKASINLDTMKLAPKDIANVLPGTIRIIKFFPSTDIRMVVVRDKGGTIGFGMWILKRRMVMEFTSIILILGLFHPF